MYFGEATINKIDIQPGTTTQISFFGKSVQLKLNKNLDKAPEEIKKKYNKIINMCCNNKSLYSYLYSINVQLWKEVNEDSYYEKDQKIKSVQDLINSIDTKQKISLYYNEYNKNVYFSGEYWVDPEHGFSINFPNGEFVKGDQKYNNVDKCTRLGQYSDGL